MTTKSFKRNGFPTVAALSLSLSLAAFGCSTNRNPGNGRPTMPVNGMPSSTPGSSSGTDGSHPMYSSSVERANAAAATMAAFASPRERDLGPAAPIPAAGNVAVVIAPTGQYVSPSATANPQATVNSSISSAATPVISSGAGGEDDAAFLGSDVAAATASGAAATAPVISGAAATTSVTAAATAVPTVTAAGTGSNVTAAAAPIITTPTTTVTPTNAATLATPGQFAATTGTVLPSATVSSAATASPTAAANPVVSAASTATGTTIATTTAPATTMASTVGLGAANVVNNSMRRTTSNTNAVRIVHGANGSIVVTNHP